MFCVSPISEYKLLTRGVPSVQVSDNYLLELLLVHNLPFRHKVGWLTAFLLSSGACVKPQAKKCRLWIGKGSALCRTTEKHSIIEDPFPIRQKLKHRWASACNPDDDVDDDDGSLLYARDFIYLSLILKTTLKDQPIIHTHEKTMTQKRPRVTL